MRGAAPAPRITSLGDVALLVTFGANIDPATHARVLALLAALDAAPPPGLRDLVPAYATLLVRFDPLCTDAPALRRSVRARLAALGDAPAEPAARTITIPVAYGGAHGPDLDDVAALLGLVPDEVVRQHIAPTYRVYFLGFSAGFPYLGEVPPALRVHRLPHPRAQVPAGSVGIAGAQTGIYPRASPGGWRIIGRTSARLFDPGATPPALLRPGDHVRFVPVAAPSDDHESVSLPTDSMSAAPSPPTIPWLRVLRAGPLATVQDRGRWGFGRFGVSPAGAADEAALLAGGALLGNPPDAAALELTLSGGTFQITCPCTVALTGAPCRAEADGRIVQFGAATPLPQGALLTIEPPLVGARAYLHVAGGIATDPVLGSRATDARAGLGGAAGRAIQPHDVLCRGPAPRDLPRRRLSPAWRLTPPAEGVWALRLLPGDLTAAGRTAYAALLRGRFAVDPQSDRMGVRLRSPDGAPSPGGEILSAGVVRGAVQVPPGGGPIILLADHQTTGGYLVGGVVISADHPMLAQMRPGDAVRFVRATGATALDALRRQTAALAAITAAPVAPDADLLARGFAEGNTE